MQVISRKNARSRVTAITSQTRVCRDSKRGRRIETEFLDRDKIHRMKQNNMEKLSASGSKIAGIGLKNPERVRKEEAGGVKAAKKYSRVG